MDYMTDIWSLIEIKRYQEAKHRIQGAMQEQPSDAELFFAAAVIENDLGNLAEAQQLVLEGLSNEPKHHGLRYMQFLVLKENAEYAEAEEVIIPLLNESPSKPDYLCGYAQLMMLTFHLEKARALCDEALRVAPENIKATSTSYLLNICSGKADASDHELQNIILQDPESEHTLSLIATDMLEKKKYRQAQNIVQELVRIDPHDQGYIDSAIEIRTLTHWTSLPNWPLNRFGWPASVAIWLVAVILLRFIGDSPEATWVTPFAYSYLAWVVYTWVQPPLLKAWLKRRGI